MSCVHCIFAILFSLLHLSLEQNCVNELLSQNPLLGVRFSTSQLTELCHRNAVWRQRSLAKADAPRNLLSPEQSNWLNDVISCQDLSCLCKLDMTGLCDQLVTGIGDTLDPLSSLGIDVPFGRKKRQTRRKIGKAIRKEYRMLSDQERNKFHVAVNKLKNDLVDGKSKYDILIIYHTPEQSPGAHFGPALLPFHRELLKIFELSLRAEDADVAIPYWDSTLDDPLPDPAHSVMWTEDFLGNGDGPVTTGPFSHWRSLHDSVVGHLHPDRHIMRDIGKSEFGGLYRESDIQQVRSISNYDDLTFCVDPFFELVHGTLHMWVGGNMAQLRISPNDPIFWLLHSFVDYIWEDWRQLKQTRARRESDYPPDDKSCNSFHYAESEMKPFKLSNKHGMQNRYTDIFHDYEPRPTCTWSRQDCGSKYIFCDTSARHPRCLSKIKVGGNCTGFDNTQICFGGRCTNGVCKGSGAVVTPKRDPPTTTTTRRTTRPTTRRTTTTTTRRTTTPRPTTTTRRTTTTTRPTTTTTTTRRMTTPTATTTTTTRPRRTHPPFSRPHRFVTRRPIPWLTPRNRAPTTTTRRTTPRPTTWAPAPKVPDTRDEPLTVWLPITVLSLRRIRITAFNNGRIISTDDKGQQLFGKFGSPSQMPYHTGAAYAQVLSPFANGGHTSASLMVMDENNRACVGMCLLSATQRPWTFSPCNTKVVLDVDPRKSDNIPFTPYENQVRFLNWQRNGRKIPDPFLFVCHAVATTRPIDRPHAARRPTTQNTVVLRRDALSNKTTDVVDLKVNKPTVKRKESTCKNSHRCCPLWADVGECRRNPWMRLECQKSCFVCNANDNIDCLDLETGCASWVREGQCDSNPTWMEEQCPRSCGVCKRTKEQLKKLCGSSRRRGECKNYNASCPRWAKNNECTKNPWWMKENCPQACGAC